MQIWFVISLLFSVIITLFAVLNPNVVTIKLFWVNYELSQSVVILVSAAFGAIITIFLGFFGKIKSSLKMRELHSELLNANQKIEALTKSLNKSEQETAIAENEKLKV